jgi:hypothetical protein
MPKGPLSHERGDVKTIQVLMLAAGLMASGASAVVMAEEHWVDEHWPTVNTSVSALLNAGWNIRQYDNLSGPAAQQELFVLLLERNGKYIRCRVSSFNGGGEPKITSSCRSMNGQTTG